jgi:hypothetical protein
MNTQYIVYQAYGKRDILNEVLVSISSLFKCTSIDTRPQIVIFTDSVSYLSSFLPLEIQLIDTPIHKWQEWKGRHDFVHRAKIEMLRHFSDLFQGGVLYCDTDTYFIVDPKKLFDKISKGDLIMHLDEGSMKNSQNLVFRKLEKFLRKYQYQGKSIPAETHMWNAGVLGFSTNDKHILDQVLDLSDDLYTKFQKHVMEQLAFSVCFQQKTRHECQDVIFHYWDFKEYRQLLDQFFQKNEGQKFESWTQEIEIYNPIKMYDSKLEFLKKPYLLRKILKFVGKGYQVISL